MTLIKLTINSSDRQLLILRFRISGFAFFVYAVTGRIGEIVFQQRTVFKALLQTFEIL